MREELLVPLEEIEIATQTLLSQTELDFKHEQIIQSVHQVSRNLTDLVVSIPDLTWNKAREVFSFESRSHLASIIGYAESLLDDEETVLNAQQRDLIHHIRQSGKTLLLRLAQLER